MEVQVVTTEEPRDPFLPLRWESTGDQWWYATPIDWAAASIDVQRAGTAHGVGGGDGNANRLLRAGYGGWLLYTATAAGDERFVRELLAAQPLLVFDEGEYSVTDILYAAARSGGSEVFRLLFNAVLSAASCPAPVGGDEFRREMMCRAVHAAARGGSLDVLRDLLHGCSDAAAYRDAQGSTILHATAPTRWPAGS
ncbi:unnamed protein product [Miscanthus lutarioriparius]|uniref:Uncharacterized protein n=1 Tax=Miscanthus lutarioriparius TaxID=422564 RepID=A0A811NCE4_9POAL|nr:unnamed protein product [Miscanthus lutarioriparius]